MKYVFGPVPSRRLGNSLGVDLLTFKACTFDCVYCQLGRTTEQTTERRSFVPADEVVAEVREVLASPAEVDCITLSGSGEPTLSLDLGRVIRAIKAMTGEGGRDFRFSISDFQLPIQNRKSKIENRCIPVAVLTNGSLLWREDVQADLAEADLVVPSLDAATQETFDRVNRPREGMSVEGIARGIRDFALGYSGRVWLEVMVVAGLNDTVEEARALVRALEGARLDKVQLNTPVRAPAEAWALPPPAERLDELARVLEALAPVDVIGRYARAGLVGAGPCARPDEGRPDPAGGATGTRPYMAGHERRSEDAAEAILATLARRPCGAAELAASLGLPAHVVVEHVRELERAGAVERVLVGGQAQYRANPTQAPKARPL